jgi:hypothetical protein
MHYVYPEYMLGGPGEIRLVTLLPGNWTDGISVKLHQQPCLIR